MDEANFFIAERGNSDGHIRLAKRYYVATFATMIMLVIVTAIVTQFFLQRHAIQQREIFLWVSQLNRVQKLNENVRTLAHVQANEFSAVQPDFLLTKNFQRQLISIRSEWNQLDTLLRQSNERRLEPRIHQRFADFLSSLDRIQVREDENSVDSRGLLQSIQEIAFELDDGIIKNALEREVLHSFEVEERSVSKIKKINALLTILSVVALLIFASRLLGPSFKNLRREHEENIRINKRLSLLAHQDALTEIPNRISFNQKLNELVQRNRGPLSESSSQSFALLLIDLDDFKGINDAFGHQVGDGLLIEIAHRITSMIERDALAARLGGDEFAVLIPQLVSENAIDAISARIKTSLSDLFNIENHTLHISASIGIAIFPQHADNAEDIIRCADFALYAAKANCRGPVIYDELVMAGRLEECQMRAAAFSAIENGEFVMYYQPKVDASSGQYLGLEALLRWRHSELGVLLPGRFLHLLNTASSVTTMTEFVVDRVARDIRRWKNAGICPGRVAVNMPEITLISNTAYEMLERAIERYSLAWSDFAVEITEDVFVNRYAEKILATAALLQSKGVSIDLDDFGTGFASLTNLRNFPFDDIKIDRSFIADIGLNEKSEKIILAMIRLAESLGKNCIAEGIETAEQLKFLQHNGCTVVQGFLFSQPQPFDVLSEILSSQKTQF